MLQALESSIFSVSALFCMYFLNHCRSKDIETLDAGFQYTLRWVLLAASVLRWYCIWRVLILAILSFVLQLF